MQRNIQSPEAVDRLMVILEDDHKAAIAFMQEEDLINLHFGLGMAIRNAFGLHEQGNKLLTSCNNNELYNSVHPDDASEVIIRQLWNKLNE
jgi:hypothetical protein